VLAPPSLAQRSKCYGRGAPMKMYILNSYMYNYGRHSYRMLK